MNCNQCKRSCYGVRVCLTCCEKLCSSCQIDHTSSKEDHVFKFPYPKVTDMCRLHTSGRFYKKYCNVCNSLICEECERTNHINHEIVPLSDARKKVLHLVEEEESAVVEILNVLNTEIETRDNAVRRLKDDMNDVICRMKISGSSALGREISGLKDRVRDKFWEIQSGNGDVCGINEQIDELVSVKCFYEEIQRKIRNILSDRYSGDSRLISNWFHYQEAITRYVVKPPFPNRTMPDLSVTYKEPTNTELENLLLRIYIGNKPLLLREEAVSTEEKTSYIANEGAANQEGHEIKKEIQILHDTIGNMRDDIVNLSTACIEGHQKFNYKTLSSESAKRKEVRVVLAEFTKQVIDLFNLFREGNTQRCRLEDDLRREQLKPREHEKFDDVNDNNVILMMEKLNKEKNEDFQRMKKQIEDLENRLTDSESKHKSAVQDVQKLKIKCNDFEEKLNISDRKLMETQRDLKGTEMENKAFKERLQELERERREKNKYLESKREEIEDLKNRLSQVAGAKLTKGNASIADLGDTFRPTRIAEMYSEMYDNEWTEAVDVLSDKGWEEDIVVNYLFITLQACYKSCQELAAEKMKRLVGTLFEHVPVEKLDSYCKSHLTEVKQLMDARKGVAVDAAELIGEDIYKKEVFVNEFRRYSGTDEVLVNHIIQHPYFAKCTTVCWLMVVQDPPMVFDEDIQEGTKLDKEVYRPYTRSGSRVLFSVWPAMFLHQNGPLLVKGVVQCTN